jgi:Tn3 transposase DDE domain
VATWAPEVLAERLLLAIHAYGTNTGSRVIAGSAQHGHGEDDIRYVRRRYLTAEVALAIAIEIANATFAANLLKVTNVDGYASCTNRMRCSSVRSVGGPVVDNGIVVGQSWSSLNLGQAWLSARRPLSSWVA